MVAESPATGRQRAAFHLLRVSAIDRLTDDSAAVSFEVPRHLRDEFSFAAGQHLAIRATIAGDDIRRNYSICAPAGSGLLRIGVKRLPDGVFSSYALDRLQVGDSLEVLSPSGTFGTQFDPLQARHYGAVAAGSGITPILSILASALAAEPGSRATLIFVNATSRSIMFLEDLEDLKNRYLGRLQIVHVLSRETQDAELLSGRLDAERLTGLLDSLCVDGSGKLTVDDWFLCGPLPLTDLVRDTLVERGTDPQHIHRELFHADALPPRAAVAREQSREDGFEVTVVLDGRTTEFTMSPDADSVLDAARLLRSEIPFACKNGVCGTCRCKLVSGTVEMAQNYALEADEVERGYVLACQSYPTSDSIVVDFDQ
ncbi:1,2-phenylacetyl-CoA epoxidase subunit PaaE [Nakamurella lactea]|uniref:1,2-phenylacetyl-CoA epoxidase subunit PaaE n=1 Tax=Nakamurella lactea TaxID=459515 RepID=UPI000565C9C9